MKFIVTFDRVGDVSDSSGIEWKIKQRLNITPFQYGWNLGSWELSYKVGLQMMSGLIQYLTKARIVSKNDITIMIV